eukprot:UN04091
MKINFLVSKVWFDTFAVLSLVGIIFYNKPHDKCDNRAEFIKSGALVISLIQFCVYTTLFTTMQMLTMTYIDATLGIEIMLSITFNVTFYWAKTLFYYFCRSNFVMGVLNFRDDQIEFLVDTFLEENCRRY